jgi:hypothetical protein
MPAPKGNDYAIGNNGGRPTDYKPEYNEQVRKLCLLGATDKDIADFFDVEEKTINNWKEKHKEFFQSMREGKEVADMEIALSMYENAKDRVVKEKKAIKLKEVFWNEEGKRCEQERVELIEEERLVQGDFRNASLWLRNRRPDKWRDRHEIDHTTNGKDINPEGIDYSKLSKETLDELEKASKNNE